MISFYRLEFVRGPYDGLVVEENAMVGQRLRLPVGVGESTPSPAEAAPVYQLSTRALRRDDGTPQAILRYEFQGNMTAADSCGGALLSNRAVRWLADRRRRLTGWMLTPVDYPLSTR